MRHSHTMAVIQPGLFLIMKRFPERKDVLRDMYLQNDAFKTLCDDYSKCKSAIDHWTRCGDELAHDRYREYVDLMRDLESELLQRLGELP